MTPQRFVVNEWARDDVSVQFCQDEPCGFVHFRVIGEHSDGRFVHSELFLGNEKSPSFCYGLPWSFEGILKTTLTGKTFHNGNSDFFTRLVAVHLQ